MVVVHSACLPDAEPVTISCGHETSTTIPPSTKHTSLYTALMHPSMGITIYMCIL